LAFPKATFILRATRLSFWGRQLSLVLAPEGSMSIGSRRSGEITMDKHRIFAMKFSSVYPLYVQKAERKNRTKEEVDQIICWLTGYSQKELKKQLDQETDFEMLRRKP
jgi:Uncharacterized protein conserved in bacteria (DUF2200)